MFPLRLNLLPPDKKRYLQRLIFAEFTKSTLESVLFIICVASIFLLLGQQVLENYFNELTENIVSISNQNYIANQEIKENNRIIKQTKSIQDKYTHWSPLFLELTNNVPTGINFTNIYFNADKKSLSLIGVAQTREELLVFEEKLRSLSFISAVNVPLSQLAEKNNIRFSINAELK